MKCGAGEGSKNKVIRQSPNENILRGMDEERSIPNIILRRKCIQIEHILRRNCLLHDFIKENGEKLRSRKKKNLVGR